MFQKGNQFGAKSKRGEGKFSKEIKERLGDISNNIVKELNIKDLSSNERIQFLRTILPYIIPKKKEVSHDYEFEEQRKFKIEIIDKTSDVDK